MLLQNAFHVLTKLDINFAFDNNEKFTYIIIFFQMTIII